MPSGAGVDTSELDRELAKIGKRVADLSPAMAEVAEILVAGVDDYWRSAGGGSWQPLAPSTLYKRRKHGAGAQILQDTGRAIASVHGTSGSTWAEAATDVSYMVFHVSDGARSKIPLRNPFDDAVIEAATPDILDAITGYMAGG